MNKKLILSVAIIVMVLAASLGATYAWFTAQSEPVENVFTAGTVIIDVNEQWQYGDEGLENWNPGDCTPKEIKLIYSGSKKAFIRMQIEESWTFTSETGIAVEETNERNISNVHWFINKGTEASPDWVEWNVDGKWKYHDGWWYYSGDDDTYSTEIADGITINSIAGEEKEIIIVARVCLDGPETGNDYQGATYKVKVLFQAIQASHEDQWNWDEVDFATGLVDESSE